MEKINDETYKRWHETYVRCTTEKEQVGKTLSGVIKAMGRADAFLDIGAGDGDLTFRLAGFFKKTTVIEPNRKVEKVFTAKNIEFIESYFEKANLGARRFDFILCSHVFWLVRREKQAAFIRKMFRHLSPEGKMAIIMDSPLGQGYEFYKKFFLGFDTTTHDILKDLHVMGLAAEVIPVSLVFRSESFDDFFDICKLFTIESWLHPVNLADERIKKQTGDTGEYTRRRLAGMRRYIKAHCRRGGEYVMKEEVDIIVTGRI